MESEILDHRTMTIFKRNVRKHPSLPVKQQSNDRDHVKAESRNGTIL